MGCTPSKTNGKFTTGENSAQKSALDLADTDTSVIQEAQLD